MQTNEDNVTRITADADTLYWSPNEIYNVALTLNVPANFSERGYMVASVPCNESCIATVENIVVVCELIIILNFGLFGILIKYI